MRTRVMIFVDWFYPAFKAGGPIKSIYHITENLSVYFDFSIICSNKDLDGEKLNVTVNSWVQKEHYKVIYLDEDRQKGGFYQKLFEELSPHVVYYNNMFSWKFGIKPLWQFKKRDDIKQIIAPRGMLGSGALRLKAKKKRAFLIIARKLMYGKNVKWHASTEQEAKEVKAVMGKHADVVIAQNLSSKPVLRDKSIYFKKEKELRMIFLSRVSVKKNLLFLLQLMKKLKKLVDLKLDIYGPIEEQSYWSKCKEIIQSDKRINYMGEIHPSKLNETLFKYHIFVLPTKHENYGHAIVEAINCGVPVLISKYTPWQNIGQEGVGEAISIDNQNEWLSQIERFYNMEGEAFTKMSDNCFDFAKRNIVNSETVMANKKLFELER